MKTKMNWSVTSVLVFALLVSQGVQTLKPEHQSSSEAGGEMDVPWHDELCCDSTGAHLSAEDITSLYKNNTEPSLLQYPKCNFRSLSEPHHEEASTGVCVNITCKIEENWLALTCELRTDHPAASNVHKAIRFQHVLSYTDGESLSEDLVKEAVSCKGNNSFKCSLPLGDTSSNIILIINISDVAASSVRLKIPQKPVKPGTPVNVSHHQTIEAELILNWDAPPEFEESERLRYEVRYSANVTLAAWQVLPAFEERRLHLDLNVKIKYTIQVRCSRLLEPPMWSEWSQPHHIYLDSVSYIPEIVKARPGEKIPIYCVFNDHNFNSSTALWTLNLQEPLHSSQYHPVNQWVSQVIVQLSEMRMYDLLQCSQESAIPYSQIYVEGAAIDIKCQTNGDISAMDCSWKNKEWTNPKFRSRWADVLCDEMEERDRAGEVLGEEGPMCENQKSCTIRPLIMNCYKLWLEMDSPLGPIKSKPIYMSPTDHVKPHAATNVKAVTDSSGALSVSWDPPSLPVEVQCQFRYHPPSTVSAQPQWKVQSPSLDSWGEVPVSDMCHSYAVEVRCQPINGTGYWSDWSKTVYSVPQNSEAPKHGPDFWRIFCDEPNGDQTTVTLLFEHLQISGHSYCVDGFIIKHQPLNGTVTEERIGLKSSHTFKLNQDVQTVTVEAYNSLGRSQNNFNMVLNRHVRRWSLRSFHVMVINNTCVSVSWSLLDNTLVPQFLVLQWSSNKQHESEHLKVQSRITWRRLQHTDRQIYLRGDFFGSEEYDFSLYPVFADGEGQPLHTKAVRRDPAAYMLLMIVSFLSIVLVITLVLTQNQMKKIIWKDVPNPNKCSWANGLNFRKVDTFDHLFRPPEAPPTWPLLVPNETISKVVIIDKPDLSVLVPLSPDPTSTTISMPPDPEEDDQSQDSEGLLVGDPSINSNIEVSDMLNRGHYSLLPSDPLPQERLDKDSSAQSSVTYATVLLSDSKLKHHFREGSGSSSSDEGNFSANNSDISESLHGALWELESCRGDTDIDNRRSCSYNFVEELSETSEPEDDKEIKQEKNLHYLRMNSARDESEEDQDDAKSNLLKSLVLSREDCSYPLLEAEDLVETSELLSESNRGLSPLYLPQYRTAPIPAHFHKL